MRREFPHPDTVLIMKRIQQGILRSLHPGSPKSELTRLNGAACTRVLMQRFDLHIVADLQGTDLQSGF